MRISLLFFLGSPLMAQNFQVTLTAVNASPNNCNSRTIQATVTGGSGSYTYYWTAQPATGVTLGNSPSITVSPSTTTLFTSAVEDNATGEFATSSISVGKILVGNFSVTIPNSFTPNGDGINDNWNVLDGNSGNGQLNAYRYQLTITNSSDQTIYSQSYTSSSGTEGITGGDISWNGQQNGNTISNGIYHYSLTLTNCSNSNTYSGTLYVLGVSSSASTLIIYPNPASDYSEIALSTGAVNYELTIKDQNGETILAESVDTPVHRIDIDGFGEGIYFILISTADKSYSSRLMIDR